MCHRSAVGARGGVLITPVTEACTCHMQPRQSVDWRAGPEAEREKEGSVEVADLYPWEVVREWRVEG